MRLSGSLRDRPGQVPVSLLEDGLNFASQDANGTSMSEQENSMDTELFEGERRALLDRDRDCSLEKHSPMVSKHRGTERQGYWFVHAAGEAGKKQRASDVGERGGSSLSGVFHNSA
jgi:hypothetical protein